MVTIISDALPGAGLIQEGFDDLARGVESIPALLVSIGAPRLRELGFDVPDSAKWPEDRLYDMLAAEDSDSAHSRYNALIRTLVSFERGSTSRPVDEPRLRQFIRAVGEEATHPAGVYLTGGATAVLEHWRESTVGIDMKIVPHSDQVLRAIPALKKRLLINVELAAPSDFIPELPGWPERSAFIVQEGKCRSITTTSTRRHWRRSSGDTGNTGKTSGR